MNLTRPSIRKINIIVIKIISKKDYYFIQNYCNIYKLNHNIFIFWKLK